MRGNKKERRRLQKSRTCISRSADRRREEIIANHFVEVVRQFDLQGEEIDFEMVVNRDVGKPGVFASQRGGGLSADTQHDIASRISRTPSEKEKRKRSQREKLGTLKKGG
jgi:hypothetical protein